MRLPLSRARQALPEGPLSDLAFFADWSDQELRAVERLAEVVEYEPGEVMTSPGPLAREFLVVLSGRAVVTVDGRATRILGRGDTVGEVAMLAGPPKAVAVVAKTPVKALLLAPQEFDSLIWQVPSMGRRLSEVLASRLREQLEVSPSVA